ncbi:hypothetical protein AWB81_07431 [Caballeronia arationis]|nr:hypothetical protein AWB81_07431 [Caballeronia arationis]
MTAGDLERLQERLARAESERDVWQCKSGHHYKMASAMVEALRKQIADMQSAQSGHHGKPTEPKVLDNSQGS